MSGRRALGYDTRFGSGWISGVAAVVLGALGLGAVLCLLFPDVLTSPETRGYYPLPAVRFLVHVVLVGAFGLGLLSVVLSRRLRLGLLDQHFQVVELHRLFEGAERGEAPNDLLGFHRSPFRGAGAGERRAVRSSLMGRQRESTGVDSTQIVAARLRR